MSSSAKGFQSMPRSRSQTAVSRPGRGQPGTFSKLNRCTQSEVFMTTILARRPALDLPIDVKP
jgi:hypothetical protein